MLNIKKSLTKIVLTVVSLFLIGCELEPQPIEYDFQLYGESLSLDENGFYHFDLSDGIVYNGITSRTKFVANTNNPNIQKVGFGKIWGRGLPGGQNAPGPRWSMFRLFGGSQLPYIKKYKYIYIYIPRPFGARNSSLKTLRGMPLTWLCFTR